MTTNQYPWTLGINPLIKSMEKFCHGFFGIGSATTILPHYFLSRTIPPINRTILTYIILRLILSIHG